MVFQEKTDEEPRLTPKLEEVCVIQRCLRVQSECFHRVYGQKHPPTSSQ